MRDTLQRQLLAGAGEVASVLAPLEWACDALVPDRHVLDQVEEVNEAESWVNAEVWELLAALADLTAPTNLPDLDARLRELDPTQLTDLATVGRKLDRMCKAETKRRAKIEGGS